MLLFSVSQSQGSSSVAVGEPPERIDSDTESRALSYGCAGAGFLQYWPRSNFDSLNHLVPGSINYSDEPSPHDTRSYISSSAVRPDGDIMWSAANVEGYRLFQHVLFCGEDKG